MASIIISSTESGSAILAQRVQMANSRFARTMQVGSSWTTIRVGIRYSYENDPGLTPVLPGMFVGLSAGTASVYGDSSSIQAVGLRSTSSGYTMTRGTIGGDFYLGTMAHRLVRRSASVETYAPPGTSGSFNLGSAFLTGSYQTAFYADFTKTVNGVGDPVISASLYTRTVTPATSGTSSVEANAFYFAMEQPNLTLANAPLPNHRFFGMGAVLYNEDCGSLDSVNVSWDRTRPVMQISDIAVYKLA